MFCRFCGKKIQDDGAFCSYCGKQLSVQQDVTFSAVQNTKETPPVTAEVQPQSEPADPRPHSSEIPTFKSVSAQYRRWIALGLFLALIVLCVSILFSTKILCFHTWEEATCTAPSTCSRCHDTTGEPLRHTLTSATCTEPVICKVCHKTFGPALGHSYREATCTRAKTCFTCHKSFGKANGHVWIEETFTTPKTCEVCGKVRPMTQPASGTVYIDAKKYYGSRLKVSAAEDYNTYLKLKDENGNDVISFYVRAGETADVRVPTGNYYLYYASGYDWYGPDLAFGSETVYVKAEEVLDFYNYTWEYILDAGEDGNAETSIIQENEF